MKNKIRTKEEILKQDHGISQFASPFPVTPILVAMDTHAIQLLVDFKWWYDKLSPAEKCTVWPPPGSGSATGLYNMQDSDIVNNYLRQLSNEAGQRVELKEENEEEEDEFDEARRLASEYARKMKKPFKY